MANTTMLAGVCRRKGQGALLWVVWSGWVAVGFLGIGGWTGCSSLPPIEEQERMVSNNNLALHRVTTRAVVHAWGKPPHHHSEFTHFFVMPDQSMVPQSRVIAGEAPRGWDAGVYAGEAVFFAYPERGWLLVFLGERLVYREELKADQLRAIAEAWAYEGRFKTRLDGAQAP